MSKSFKHGLINDLREQFVPAMAEAFADKYELSISTEWNLIHMRYVTTPDGFTMTHEHQAFLMGFEAAWLKAQGIVCERKE